VCVCVCVCARARVCTHNLSLSPAPKEIITKYKLINKNLPLIHEQKESENKLDEGEQKKFIDNNIWVYLNKSINFHKPIYFNINDEIIKSYSKNNVELLILNIIESVKLYPRQYLFMHNKGEQYTEKGLQFFLYEPVTDKNIGINALRSIYTSHYLPKLNKNQINRVSFLMRTSFNMLSTNYLKKNEDEEQTNIINKNVEKLTIYHNNKQKPTTQAPRDRKQYLNDYYEKKKQKMKEQIKNNEKEKTYKIRLQREINNGLINISTVRKSTVEKYNIKFDEKTNTYISE
jgi:hypothetical protein